MYVFCLQAFNFVEANACDTNISLWMVFKI